MLKRFPPVRRAVPWRRVRRNSGAEVLREHFPHLDLHFFESGTASLAAALADARSQSDATRPEAVIPAYGCPDLVTACVQAGVAPRLVDVEASAWGYQGEALRAAVGRDTVAIVAVNLLGAGDQANELSSFARERGIPLIQDSAQYLPDRRKASWPGDYVVLSFGRGKPMNMLQGGALLARPERSDMIARAASRIHGARLTRYKLLSSSAAAVAFNLMSHPVIYRIAAKLPGLGVGETRYSVLEERALLPSDFATRVSDAFENYASHANYRTACWQPMLERWEKYGLHELRSSTQRVQDDGQRLRLPLLASSSVVRDELVRSLGRGGFGASAMYELPLSCIADVPDEVRQQGPFPGASSLAARLLTLPTHSCIDDRVVGRVDEVVMKILTRQSR